MAQATMKEDALPQIYFVRDTDLGMFAYELHILAGDFLRESEFNLHSLAANTGPDSIAIELVKLFCNTYKEKFRQDHACILFSNGVIYPLDECGRI